MPRDPINATYSAFQSVLTDAVRLTDAVPVEYVPYHGGEVPDNAPLPYMKPGVITSTPTVNGRELTVPVHGWTKRRNEAALLISQVTETVASERPRDPIPLPRTDGFVFITSVAEFTTVIEENDPKGDGLSYHAVMRFQVRAQDLA